MSKRILLIQGHPDAGAQHLCHALAGSYVEGALAGGHRLRQCHVAALNFPLLRSQQDFETGTLPATLQAAQDDLAWCEHLVLLFPLWAGGMPALLKGFLEQLLRPDFTGSGSSSSLWAKKPLSGRSARLVVTMGMPALVYRWYFRAHGVKSLQRNMLGLVGIRPVDVTLIGGVANNLQTAKVGRWLGTLKTLGEKGG